jgi:hypothetical protein
MCHLKPRCSAKELHGIKAPERPEVYATVPADIREVAKEARTQFADPLKKFEEKYSALNAALFGDMIDVGEYQRMRDHLVKQTAEALHMDNKPHLADAAIVGSQEDARLLSNFFAGQQQTSTNDLLGRILEAINRLREKVGDIQMPKPAIIGLAGIG